MGELHKRTAKLPAFLATLLTLLVLLVLTACSDDDATGPDTTQEFVEGTLSSPASPGDPGATTTIGGTGIGTTGGTIGTSAPDALLRLEGDPETTFSGFCTAGTEESVISGRVPKRYRFELNGQELSCRIQKQNPGNSSLRVILLSGGDTRSVQQTSSTNSTIRLSYTGG